jgi:hypothetical protein
MRRLAIAADFSETATMCLVSRNEQEAGLPLCLCRRRGKVMAGI